jgi:hypothetical protein
MPSLVLIRWLTEKASTGHADGRDRERQDGEQSDQRGIESLGCDRFVADLLERLHMVDGAVRVQLADRFNNARCQAIRRAGRPHEQRGLCADLCVGLIQRQHRVVVDAVGP